MLETPALDYYTEEAVAKILEGHWKWQDRYTLAQQLIEIAGNLITKQAEKYAREHPWVKEHENEDDNDNSVGGYRKTNIFVHLDDLDIENYPEVIDEDDAEEMDETYEMVMHLVSDDKELVLYVEAIRACGHFDELPDYLGMPKKKVYRL